MIMNISNNGSSGHHHGSGVDHHRGNVGALNHHHHHNHHFHHHPHHPHSNGQSAVHGSYLGDFLPGELLGDTDHFRSRLTMQLQDENALGNYRSASLGSYYPPLQQHGPQQHFSPGNHGNSLSQSIVPAVEELISTQSSPQFVGKGSQCGGGGLVAGQSYYDHHLHHPNHPNHHHSNEQQQLLTGDTSPLPATSATSALATSCASSPPPPTSALPSASPPKRSNFLASATEYNSSESAFQQQQQQQQQHHHQQHHHHHHQQIEAHGASELGSSLKGSNSMTSTAASTVSSLKTAKRTTTAASSTTVVLSKTPMQDHNSQSNFSENICFGCRETLASSRIIVSVSGHHNYHTSCLCCCECGQSLCQFPTCYIRHGRMYCKEDYAKLVKCSKCSRPIAADDWVRRAGELVYHLACFSCDLCQRQLSTGENFTVVRQDPAEWRLLCKLHFSVKSDKDETKNQVENGSSDVELASPGALSQSAATMLISDSNGGANTNNSNANNANNGTPSGALTPTGQRTTGGGGGGGSSGSSSSNSALSASSSSKTKRVRTTFTEEQLSVLQANFQLDSNPDGQDLERIATLTGLSKRVTQVWFQNSRARQKKYMNKSHQRHSPGLLATVGGGGGPSSMLLNGGGGGGAGNGHGGLWSPGSSTGSSTGNDCLAAVAAAAVHTVSNNNNSQALSLDCLSGVGSGAGGGSTGTGGGCLSTPSTAKWAQSNSSNSLNNNLNDSTTVSSQCTESEHSSSPQHM